MGRNSYRSPDSARRVFLSSLWKGQRFRDIETVARGHRMKEHSQALTSRQALASSLYNLLVAQVETEGQPWGP